MSNKHGAVYSHETTTLNLFVVDVPRFQRNGMKREIWHILIIDRSTRLENVALI